MNFLLDPNVAYLILVIGMFLAILALVSPGTGLLEVGALILIVMAGYSIYNLPINLWALIVLVLGVFPFLVAVRKSGRWVFLLISLVAMAVGSIFLFRNESGGPAVSPVLAIVTVAITTSLLWILVRKGIEAMRLKPEHQIKLEGQIGEAKTDVFNEGTVYAGGENWSATSKRLIPAGSRVRVIHRDGFVLEVEEIESKPE
jgi:membrane-bound serine protease (ClpP class)